MEELELTHAWQVEMQSETHLPDDPTVPLLGIHPQAMGIYVHSKTYTCMYVHSSSVHDCQQLEMTRMSFSRGVNPSILPRKAGRITDTDNKTHRLREQRQPKRLHAACRLVPLGAWGDI